MKLLPPNKTFAVAPMLDYTDRHFRYLARLMSKSVRLYTEMVTTKAILHGDARYHLQFNKQENPLALQLGGSCPKELTECSQIASDYGYDEINLNIGCPSTRVQKGRFGACLMREPELVAECVSAIKSQVNIPVTIKTRIGVDNDDSYEFLHRFVKFNVQAGCNEFTIHARKALLKGLSPKENRTIPPLDYSAPIKLKKDFPGIRFILNGGIETMESAKELLKHNDGVMIGRQFYKNIYWLREIDSYYDSNVTLVSRENVIEQYLEYIKQEMAKKEYPPLRIMLRHLMNLYNGENGAKNWRQMIANANNVFDVV